MFFAFDYLTLSIAPAIKCYAFFTLIVRFLMVAVQDLTFLRVALYYYWHYFFLFLGRISTNSDGARQLAL